MRKRLFSILQFCIFFGLGIFLVWWSIHKMDNKNWEDCKTAMKSARYLLMVPVFLIMTLSHISRAIRWKILMAPMGYNPSLINTFCAVMVGYLANLAFPRLGEVLKCTILGKYEKVPADKLIGTILVERAVDVVSLAIVFIIALLSQADIIGAYAKQTINDKFLSGTKESHLIKFSILIAAIVLIYFLLKFLFRRFGHTAFINKIKNIVTGVGIGLSTIKMLNNKWTFIFHSILIWSCYAAGTYIGFFAIKETSGLPFAATFPVLAFASIGMILTPGGIGAYPLFIMQVMALYDIEEGFGFANGTLQWAAQFMIILVVGFISLLLLPIYNKKLNHAKHTINTG
ncbi:MAG: lysylphosphatidylglycerol synthase transmembrane domain-containing protein [Ferruginibacter sp.]